MYKLSKRGKDGNLHSEYEIKGRGCQRVQRKRKFSSSSSDEWPNDNEGQIKKPVPICPKFPTLKSMFFNLIIFCCLIIPLI